MILSSRAVFLCLFRVLYRVYVIAGRIQRGRSAMPLSSLLMARCSHFVTCSRFF